jgi:hypothetical protein
MHSHILERLCYPCLACIEFIFILYRRCFRINKPQTQTHYYHLDVIDTIDEEEADLFGLDETRETGLFMANVNHGPI